MHNAAQAVDPFADLYVQHELILITVTAAATLPSTKLLPWLGTQLG